MKVIVERELFHQMMRGIAGGFRPDTMCNVEYLRMRTLADRLAQATAARTEGRVEVDV